MGAKKTKKSKLSKVKTAGRSALSAVMGKTKGKGGRRSRKKSALWYAKEIQRIRLKRKYERVKLSLGR